VPFDHNAGYWLVSNVRDYVAAVGDAQLADQALDALLSAPALDDEQKPS
jgi:hypothetical protein